MQHETYILNTRYIEDDFGKKKQKKTDMQHWSFHPQVLYSDWMIAVQIYKSYSKVT